jgi:hypothetical protein
MKELLKKIYKKYSSWIIALLITIIVGLVAYVNYQINNGKKMMDEIDYVDSINQYHKYFYETKFRELKKTNKELYDSLKQYKDKITYLIQFTHEKDYNTGVINTKPNIVDTNIKDSMKVDTPLVAKTYEYMSEPNDTFQYKLNVNSYTEPNWYSIQAKVKNKFTIVNKEEGGMNHVTIQPNDGGNVSNVTVFKKKEKRSFWNRFSFGPGFTVGYDPINKQWGMTAGLTGTFDLK